MQKQVTEGGSHEGGFPVPDSTMSAPAVEITRGGPHPPHSAGPRKAEARSATLAPPPTSTAEGSGDSTGFSPAGEAGTAIGAPTAAPTAVPPAAAPVSGVREVFRFLRPKRRGKQQRPSQRPPIDEEGTQGVFGVTPDQLAGKQGECRD